MTVTLRIEGGITAMRRVLVLEEDGACRVDRGGVVVDRQVGPATVEAIVAGLDRSGLFDRDREYPPGFGMDLQRYEIVHRGVTVVAYDTTVPPELSEVLLLLGALIHPSPHA